MKPEDFSPQAAGRLVTASVQLAAGTSVQTASFVPHPLPPVDSQHLSQDVRRASERALLALGELRAIIPSLPNPKLITVPFLRREAVLSSRIEGTRTEIDGLFVYETKRAEGHAATPDDDDAREVLNYVRALEQGLEMLQTLPICLRLIKAMHKTLMDEVRDERGRTKRPGQFRDSLAYIGNGDIASARYVAPPAEALDQLMSDLERYINQPDPCHTLANIAMIHYQFEAIHPFADGNGRLGRLLILLLLIEREILPAPLLYLSAYFERNRSQYYDSMMRVSTHGDWESWIRFVLTGVRSEAQDACRRGSELRSLREEFRSRVQVDGRSASLLTLVDKLFEWPTITVKRAGEILQMSYQGARNNVDRLVEFGILKEVTGRSRDMVFSMTHVIDLLR